MMDIPKTPHETVIKAYQIGKEAGLKYVYVGNVMDEKRSSTYCPNCDELLIRRQWHDTQVEKIHNGRCTACKMRIPGVWT